MSSLRVRDTDCGVVPFVESEVVKMRVPLLLASLFVSVPAFALSFDTGRIKTVFVNPNGSVAFSLVSGFPVATANGECQTHAGYAGAKSSSSPDPAFKQAVLSAKALGQTVTVGTQGCETGGGWLKVQEMYFQ